MASYDNRNKQVTRYLSESYGRYSEEYVHLEPSLQPIAVETCRLVSKARGSRVLDLATGTGLVARALEEANLSVIGVDVAFGAVLSAHRLSLGQAAFVAGDAHTLPFRSGCVDHVTCGLGLSHFADILTALAEIRRILCPGGHMLASAWGNNFEIPSFSSVVDLLYQYLADVDNPSKGALDEKTWGDPASGCTVLEQAGFENIRVSTIPFSDTFRDIGEALDYALAWPTNRSLLMLLDPTDRERVCEEAVLAIAKHNNLSQGGDIHYYQAINPNE